MGRPLRQPPMRSPVTQRGRTDATRQQRHLRAILRVFQPLGNGPPADLLDHSNGLGADPLRRSRGAGRSLRTLRRQGRAVRSPRLAVGAPPTPHPGLTLTGRLRRVSRVSVFALAIVLMAGLAPLMFVSAHAGDGSSNEI